MAKAKTKAKDMTSEILDRLDVIENDMKQGLQRVFAVEGQQKVYAATEQRQDHQLRGLEEAICPRVAARLTHLERIVGDRGDMPLPLYDCIRMRGLENRAVHERFQAFNEKYKPVPSGTEKYKPAPSGTGQNTGRARRLVLAIQEKFGVEFSISGVEELLRTVNAVS